MFAGHDTVAKTVSPSKRLFQTRNLSEPIPVADIPSLGALQGSPRSRKASSGGYGDATNDQG